MKADVGLEAEQEMGLDLKIDAELEMEAYFYRGMGEWLVVDL
jgi:hypothetical protein